MQMCEKEREIERESPSKEAKGVFLEDPCCLSHVVKFSSQDFGPKSMICRCLSRVMHLLPLKVTKKEPHLRPYDNSQRNRRSETH